MILALIPLFQPGKSEVIASRNAARKQSRSCTWLLKSELKSGETAFLQQIGRLRSYFLKAKNNPKALKPIPIPRRTVCLTPKPCWPPIPRASAKIANRDNITPIKRMEGADQKLR